MSTATTEGGADGKDESTAPTASSSASPLPSASASATLPTVLGGSYRDDNDKKAGGGGGTDDESGSEQEEEGGSSSLAGSDFEPLRRFRDDDQNQGDIDLDINLDGLQFEPLPPLQYDYGTDAEAENKQQHLLQEDTTADLDPTLLTLLARLGQDGDDEDDQVDEQVDEGDGTVKNNNKLDALAGDYREPTSGIANLDDEDDDDDLLLLDYNYNHGGLDDPAFREALETGAALTAVFDDDDEGNGSAPTEAESASASDEASVEDKDVDGNLDLADPFGGLTLGADESATAAEETPGEFVEPAEEEGSSSESDAAAFAFGQEFNPYLPAFCLPCADQPFLHLQQSGSASETESGQPPSENNNIGTAPNEEESPTIFALSPEEEAEEERKLREKRNALLQLSALGRRKLGVIAEEGGGQQQQQKGGLPALSEEDDAVDTAGGREHQPQPISRLSYDLDTVDMDSVTAPEELLDLDVVNIAGVEGATIDWDGTTTDASGDPAFSLPPGFHDNFEAAVMQHLMGEMEETATETILEDEEGGEESGPVEMATIGGSAPIAASNHNINGAAEAASLLVEAFGSAEGATESPKNERQMIGHKGKIFCMAFSPCGSYLVSASEDSTAAIWDVKTHRCLHTLAGHSKNHEQLRVAWSSPKWKSECLGDDKTSSTNESPILGTAGADGVVKLWEMQSDAATGSTKWKCIAQKDHSPDSAADENKKEGTTGDGEGEVDAIEAGEDEEDESPQIYALQFIDDWAGHPVLLTSSDDFVNIWTLDKQKHVYGDTYQLTKAMTLRFSHVQHANGGVSFQVGDNPWVVGTSGDAGATAAASDDAQAFGGHRNPDNLVYVFDASYCEANGLLGVALADGTLRLVNPRGICLSVLSLPGCESHLTSFSWDSTGTRLASCVGTGHIVLWHVESSPGSIHIRVNCTCVLGGGHAPGRPIFGVKYFAGPNEVLLLSWGVDGKVCVWDRSSEGEIHEPITTLLAKADYPIYACDITETTEDELVSRIAIGGGNDGGFLGVPAFLYDVKKATATDGKK